jgi:hypothetical protein
MKTEYFKNEEFSIENLQEPWKENFTREEVEELRKEAFNAGVNWRDNYWQFDYETDFAPDFNNFKEKNPL